MPFPRSAESHRRVILPGLEVVFLIIFSVTCTIATTTTTAAAAATSPPPRLSAPPPKTLAPPPPPTLDNLWKYAPWLRKVWKYSGAEYSFPSVSFPLQANAVPYLSFYSPPVKFTGYGPCPYKDPSSRILPTVKMPVWSMFALTSNTNQQASSLFTLWPVSLLAGKTVFSWATEFYFQTTSDGCTEDVWGPNGVDSDTCASGFTFVLQSFNNTAVGGNSGDMGYGNLQTQQGVAIKSSLAVEFDMRASTRYNDPDGNHIAIVRDGVPRHNLSNPSTLASWPRTFNDGNIKRVVVVYDKGMLFVYFSDTPVEYPRLAISYPTKMPSSINLSNVYAGFTAATGIFPQTMDLRVYNWRFFYANPLVAPPGPSVPSLPRVPSCSPPPPHPSPPPPPSPPGPQHTAYFVSGIYESVIYVCPDALNLATCSGIVNPTYWQYPYSVAVYNGKAYITSLIGVAICNDTVMLTGCVLRAADGNVSLILRKRISFYQGRAYLTPVDYDLEHNQTVICNNASNLTQCFSINLGFTQKVVSFYNNMAFIGGSGNDTVTTGIWRCNDTAMLSDCNLVPQPPGDYSLNKVEDIAFVNSRAYIVGYDWSKISLCTQPASISGCKSTEIYWTPTSFCFVNSGVYVSTRSSLYYCPDALNLDTCDITHVFPWKYFPDCFIV